MKLINGEIERDIKKAKPKSKIFLSLQGQSLNMAVGPKLSAPTQEPTSVDSGGVSRGP